MGLANAPPSPVHPSRGGTLKGVGMSDPFGKAIFGNESLLTVSINLGGVTYTEHLPLPEVVLKSQGPMSIESGCMSAIRELSQRIWRRVIAREGRGCGQ